MIAQSQTHAQRPKGANRSGEAAPKRSEATRGAEPRKGVSKGGEFPLSIGRRSRTYCGRKTAYIFLNLFFFLEGISKSLETCTTSGLEGCWGMR